MNKFRKNLFKWRGVITVLVLLLVFIAIAGTYYSYIRRVTLDNVKKELSTICELKNQQISEWVEERFDELEFFSDSPQLSDVIDSYNAKQPQSVYEEDIKVLTWLRSERKYYSVMLLNNEVKPVICVDENVNLLNNPHLRDVIDHTLYSGHKKANVVWFPELNRHFVQFVLPITQPSTKKIIGVLVGLQDPSDDLSDLVSILPTGLKTSEVFIAKTIADSVVALTAIKGLPLNKQHCLVRLSELNNPEHLSTIIGPNAVNRIDFRGNPVILYSKQLPINEWSLICKVDVAEIDSGLFKSNLFISIGFLALVIIVSLVLYLSSTIRDRLILKKSLDREKTTSGKMLEYKFMMQNISCSVISVDSNDIVRFINPAGCLMLGYDRNECIGKPVASIFAPTHINDKHYLLVNRNNAEYHIEINETPNNDSFGVNYGRLFTFRDISDTVIQHDLLIKSYSLFNSMFENSPQPMFVYEIDSNRILQINRAACESLGYKQDEVDGLLLFSIIHEDEFEKLRNISYNNSIEQGEWKLITKSRNIIYIEVFGHNVTFNDKLCRHIMFNDISQRKRAQDELANSERRYRTLIDILPDALLLHKDNVITFANKSAIKLLKAKNEDEVIGKTLLELFPPEDCADIVLREANVRQSRGGMPLVERSLICLDKTIKSVETTTTFYSDDKSIGSQIIIHDLTLRNEAQKKIIESEKRYRDLVEISPEAIFILKQSRIVFANQAAANLLGVSSVDELVDKLLRNFFLDNEIESILERGREVESTKSFVPIAERKLCRVDGKVIDVESSVAYLNSDNGEISLQAIVRDISARKKMEAEIIEALRKAEESDKLKSSFLANFSHEIRTPINSIVGFAEMLLHFDDVDLASRNEYLTIIQKSSFRLLNVISDTIEISKIDSGAISIYNMPIVVNDFLGEVYNQQAGIALKKNLSFELVPPADPMLIIYTDKNKLALILNNLISNSIKYTNEGGVLLSVKVENGNLKFKVKDTGIGIKPENLHMVFIRFHRIESPTTTREGGIGLGLPIAKAYAKLLNGEITVESTFGVGSEFVLTIPLTIPTTEQINQKNIIHPSSIDLTVSKFSDEAKILVAEDDDSSYRLLHDLLTSMGYAEVRACNGRDAVDIVKKSPGRISLILMDIKMPIMDGYEAFISIRNFNKSIPIIAQTAHVLAEENIRIGELGFDGLITKPINRETLLSIIEKYIPRNNNNLN